MPRQYYTWKAIYTDGSAITELKPDGTDNSFYDIDRTRLAQFILTGEDWRIWFSARTGEWYFNNELITSIPSEYFNLPVSYGEGLIQYKDGEDDIVQKTINLGSKTLQYGKLHTIIRAHYMGYKFTHGNQKVQIIVRIIPDDPMTAIPEDTKVDIKITTTDLTTNEVKETMIGVIE